MSGLILHPMKEIKIIIEGEHLKFVSDLLDKVKATGYTVISNISGKGHHGMMHGSPMQMHGNQMHSGPNDHNSGSMSPKKASCWLPPACLDKIFIVMPRKVFPYE